MNISVRTRRTGATLDHNTVKNTNMNSNVENVSFKEPEETMLLSHIHTCSQSQDALRDAMNSYYKATAKNVTATTANEETDSADAARGLKRTKTLRPTCPSRRRSDSPTKQRSKKARRGVNVSTPDETRTDRLGSSKLTFLPVVTPLSAEKTRPSASMEEQDAAVALFSLLSSSDPPSSDCSAASRLDRRLEEEEDQPESCIVGDSPCLEGDESIRSQRQASEDCASGSDSHWSTAAVPAPVVSAMEENNENGCRRAVAAFASAAAGATSTVHPKRSTMVDHTYTDYSVVDEETLRKLDDEERAYAKRGRSCDEAAAEGASAKRDGDATHDGGEQQRRPSSSSSSPLTEEDRDRMDKIRKLREMVVSTRAPRRNSGGVAQPFPEKLMEVLDRDDIGEIISWMPHGRAFIVREPKVFTATILQCVFKQTKFMSFTRQLNLWGFKRITRGRDTGAYYHELFLRGRPRLSRKMRRQKIKGTGIKLTPNPDAEPDFYRMSRKRPLPSVSVGKTGQKCLVPVSKVAMVAVNDTVSKGQLSSAANVYETFSPGEHLSTSPEAPATRFVAAARSFEGANQLAGGCDGASTMETVTITRNTDPAFQRSAIADKMEEVGWGNPSGGTVRLDHAVSVGDATTARAVPAIPSLSATSSAAHYRHAEAEAFQQCLHQQQNATVHSILRLLGARGAPDTHPFDLAFALSGGSDIQRFLESGGNTRRTGSYHPQQQQSPAHDEVLAAHLAHLVRASSTKCGLGASNPSNDDAALIARLSEPDRLSFLEGLSHRGAHLASAASSTGSILNRGGGTVGFDIMAVARALRHAQG